MENSAATKKALMATKMKAERSLSTVYDEGEAMLSSGYIGDKRQRTGA